MEIQPQLVLLQKTLLYIEGLGRQLYPELDLWQSAKPFMDEWLAERIGPLAAIRSFTEAAPRLAQHLPRLPDLIINTGRQLKVIEHGLAEQRAAVRELEAAVARLDRERRLRRWSGTVLIVVATVILWEPLVHLVRGGAGDGSLATAAGLVSALTGTFLLLRG
jgi:ubiquinone biosynthesis protein